MRPSSASTSTDLAHAVAELARAAQAVAEIAARLERDPAQAARPQTLLTLTQLAERCGCSVPTMRATLRRRGIEGIRIGDFAKYDADEVIAQLREPEPENVVRLSGRGRR